MQEIIADLNREALQSLQKEEYRECLELLQKAQRIYDIEKLNFPKLQAAILNNYACYYRANCQFKEALQYLLKVAQMEQRIKRFDSSSLACTHLNLSAVYCDLKCFQIALQHAKTAYSILYNNEDPSLNSQKMLCYLTLSNLYVQIKHFQEAISVLSSAIKQEYLQEEPKQELINVLQKEMETIYQKCSKNPANQRNLSLRTIQVSENNPESRAKSYKDEELSLPYISLKSRKETKTTQPQNYFMPQLQLNRYRRPYQKKDKKRNRSLNIRRNYDNSTIRIYQYNNEPPQNNKNNVTIE